MPYIVRPNFQDPIGIVTVLPVCVHRNMSIVEMGNVSTINIVGTENVITVKTLKHAPKNAKNVVGMESVVPWKTAQIV